MGSIQVSQVSWKLPSGLDLFRDLSFSVGSGERVALVGANGVGKSTLLRLMCGEDRPTSGTIAIDGRVGVMRQKVGVSDAPGGESASVRSLLLSLSPDRVRDAASQLDAAIAHLDTDPLRYANALSHWGDVGGYDIEVRWDEAVDAPSAPTSTRWPSVRSPR